MLKVDVKPMKSLSKGTREIICRCSELCENYVHIEDYGRFCEGDTVEFAYMLIKLLKGGSLPNGRCGTRDWTIKEVTFLLNWYNKGIRYGDRKLIAESLGRTEKSVSSKLDEMKRDGII